MPHHKQAGFTLIELMLSLALGAVVITTLYSGYTKQQATDETQKQIVEMQQNLRAALFFMESRIRMAGYDPTGSAGATIVKALPDLISFTTDSGISPPNGIIGDPGKEEYMAFDYYKDTDDPNKTIELGWLGDDAPITVGEESAGSGHYVIKNPAPGPYHQSIADNIQAIGFGYAYDNNDDGQLDTSAGGHVIWAVDSNNDGLLDLNLDQNDDGQITSADAAGGTSTLIEEGDGAAPAVSVPLSKIRSVQIWLVARSSRSTKDANVTGTFIAGRKMLSPNSAYYWRSVSTIVQCRNLGL